MNSRSGVNQSSLVNFPSDLPSLDAKTSLLSFPFDHLYACHSASSEQRDGLQVTKESDLPTQCGLGDDKNPGASSSTEVEQLNDRLLSSENQNKRLKDLLIYHLDLIQQQNELITKRDKLYQALRLENQNLKTKLNRRHGLNLPPPPPLPPPVILPPPPPPPLPQPPPAPPVTSTVVKPEASQVMLDSFSELMLPEKRSNSYLFDTDLSQPKKFEKETFGIARTTTTAEPDVKTYGAGDIGVPSVLEGTSKAKYTSMRCEGFKPIDSKRSLVKKDALKTETRSEALYTITSTSSGNPVIQRVQRNRKRNSTGVGHLSRMTKTTPKAETSQTSKLDDPVFDNFSINKKNKFINTYGKSKTAITSTATSTTTTMSKRTTFGSLSERLQLIDTTPTGEDPYQLGEADLREQSPIPKLMLQKTNHGRMKVLDQPTRRIYDPDSPEPKSSKPRSNRFLASTFTADLKRETKTMMIQEPDLDLVKTEPEINWRIYSPKFKTAIETCTSATPPLPISEFSFTDVNALNALNINLDCVEFQDIFSDTTLNLEELNVGSNYNADGTETVPEEREQEEISQDIPQEMTPEMTQQISQVISQGISQGILEGISQEMSQDISQDISQEISQQFSQAIGQDMGQAESFMTPFFNAINDVQQDEQGHLPDDDDNSLAFAPIEPIMPSTSKGSKRGRKRAYSTTGLGKGGKDTKTAAKPRGRGKAAARGKKTPPPGRTTREEYFTHVSDSDLSWYFGLDSDVKAEDLGIDTLDPATSTVEVPRWRELPLESLFLEDSEVTEILEDKVFEKRHQKLEAEERRQLRWHMRRIREQRHVEKLRQRQRDSWCTTVTVPSVYTVWPRPQRDIRFIEITDTIPVMAFGEALPDLPEADFMLPWVRTSKALKRSKRSKTLH